MPACDLNLIPIFTLPLVRGCGPIGFRTDAKPGVVVERIAAMIAGTREEARSFCPLPVFRCRQRCLPGCCSAVWTFPFRYCCPGSALFQRQQDDVAHQIVWQFRLPRVLAAFACGGLLALAGVLLQVLLRNPLADPYILGVSGGAAVGALLAMLLGWGWC